MRWAVVCVVLLAAVAGCSALGTQEAGTPSPTVTPAPVPSPTPTPATAVPSVAPGVSTTGVADPALLVDSHARAARNTSWEWTERSIVRQSLGNGTVNTTSNQSVRFVDERTYQREASLMSIRRGQQLQFLQDYEQYANGDVAYETWFSPAENRVVYRRQDSPTVGDEYAGFGTGAIRDYLTLESATVSRVAVGDRQHYQIVGTRSRVPDYGPVDSYRARAVVREDGFVRSLNVSYALETDDLRVEGRYIFRYTQVGNVTIERPDWVETARNRTE